MTTSPRDNPCSILLLAGGRGQRMGGQDKGLMLWNERPLIAYVHEVVRPLTTDLIISCNRNQARYAAFADQLVGDEQQDFPGPLAGVLAGLGIARHPWMLVLACDAPRIDRALIEQLLSGADSAASPLMVRQAGQWQPMFSLIPTTLLPVLRKRWEAGERSLLRALLGQDLRAMECTPDDPRLTNFNTPDLLKT
ncbi:molybdenum cofactor guanylyltransferase MobA [Pseudomonas sp. CCI3.2]|uniref:molybdenum cofactor guanylyltransferase MobA n=1 Tax=unclassified Pseudomonas TaxID=196821 RepID=UPI002AC98C3D|nr:MULTISPECIES: molybdenum cofactor guanylyltransferase MobA [unclassified Pseudomonas]MEB0076576.1 molybdenum cofactor guanylyltransferase MobA [Pseudomonas sp. MH10out]MEB0100664.1 molybdenum cofactor guanylyltransferase MobA [Pseudomonas sp. CCI3.2]MEB0130279.1 molybdenum cofactor guanylyltransferase MobA [Pseudomonas sp. CCI2.4]MEB0158807.1 molybdenum cofactor guanylyltransferase MobA [Pseudomonas sp. AH2 (2023)]MEB0169286.1 molybdenum cofactor guanylyltransferase MobA [Pseudomonas sp. CC